MKDLVFGVLTFASILWLLRSTIILLFAFKQKQRSAGNLDNTKQDQSDFNDPSVSILIPAFNEARTIARCM